jgi:hypothetical protein
VVDRGDVVLAPVNQYMKGGSDSGDEPVKLSPKQVREVLAGS